MAETHETPNAPHHHPDRLRRSSSLAATAREQSAYAGQQSRLRQFPSGPDSPRGQPASARRRDHAPRKPPPSSDPQAPPASVRRLEHLTRSPSVASSSDQPASLRRLGNLTRSPSSLESSYDAAFRRRLESVKRLPSPCDQLPRLPLRDSLNEGLKYCILEEEELDALPGESGGGFLPGPEEGKQAPHVPSAQELLTAPRPPLLRRPSSYDSGLDSLALEARGTLANFTNSPQTQRRAFSPVLGQSGPASPVLGAVGARPPPGAKEPLLRQLNLKPTGSLSFDDLRCLTENERQDTRTRFFNGSRIFVPDAKPYAKPAGRERMRQPSISGPSQQRIMMQTTTHISNMSIFKQAPGEAPDTCITIYQNLSDDDLGRHSPNNTSIERSIKAFKRIGDKTDDGQPSIAVKDLSRRSNRKLDIRRPEPPPLPDPSVATFVTTTSTNKVRKTREDRILPKTERHWTSDRMVSFRNLLALVNTLVLSLSIAVIGVVGYFSGIEYSSRHRIALAMNAGQLVSRALSEAFHEIEQLGFFSEPMFNIDNKTLDSVYFVGKHFYVAFQRPLGIRLERLFAVDDRGLLNGIGIYRLANGMPDPDHLSFQVITASTVPMKATFQLPANCDAVLQQCFPDLNARAYEMSYEDVKAKPYYSLGLSSSTARYTGISPINSNGDLGLTFVVPVHTSGSAAHRIVTGVDVTLEGIADYLKSLAKNFTFERSHSSSRAAAKIYIAERATGNLVATSENDAPYAATVDGRQERLRAADSPDPGTRKLAGLLAGQDGGGGGQPVELARESSGGVVAVVPFQIGNDVDWVITLDAPYNVFAVISSTAYISSLLLTGAVVLVTSLISSYLVTRAIGQRLKTTAMQLMDIAELNFDSPTKPRRCSAFSSRTSMSNRLRLYRNTSGETRRRRHCMPSFELKEVKYIQAAMSSMTTGLKSFSKYVPLDVVTLLVKMQREAVLGVDETDLTIFFSDIANFTTISEQMTPANLVTLMSEYLHEMSNIILESQGIVDKYIGDAVMAFWNAPLFVEDHPIVACGAALKYQQRLCELRDNWVQRGYPEIYARVGMNTGKVLVGNFGSPDRLNYTCLGDNVNLASRLEGLNKYYGTEIIVSGTVFDNVQEHFVCRTLDSVAVKGKSVPTKVHELIAFRALASELLLQKVELYEQAYNLYCEANFLEAKLRFEKFLRLQPDDLPAEKHMSQCEIMLLEPPGAFWRPIVVLEGK